MQKIEKERVERVARIYASNEDASRALGMRSFGRLCRHYGIETPYVRRRRHHREVHQRKEDLS